MLDECLRDRCVPILIAPLAFSLQLKKIKQNLCPICQKVLATLRSVNLAAFYGQLGLTCYVQANLLSSRSEEVPSHSLN